MITIETQSSNTINVFASQYYFVIPLYHMAVFPSPCVSYLLAELPYQAAHHNAGTGDWVQSRRIGRHIHLPPALHHALRPSPLRPREDLQLLHVSLAIRVYLHARPQLHSSHRCPRRCGHLTSRNQDACLAGDRIAPFPNKGGHPCVLVSHPYAMITRVSVSPH